MESERTRPTPAGDEGLRDPAVLRTALDQANIPTLLMVLYHTTGDRRWLRDPYQPSRTKGLGDNDSGGLEPARQEEVRRAATREIARLLRGAELTVGIRPTGDIADQLSVSMGEHVPRSYGEMVGEEIVRRMAPTSPLEPVSRPGHGSSRRNAIVIGGGPAGIIAVQALQALDISWELYDSQPGPGGVWRQNCYPGVSVDTPSHLYSYSFANNDWTAHFPLGSEIVSYFERTSSQLGDGGNFYYGTTVLKAAYDERHSHWDVTVRHPNGDVVTRSADIVLSAVGALNRPVVPAIPGRDDFRGATFHSSCWPPALDLTGKRVAIVGTGASSMQIVPAIADRVRKAVIFQRSPQWAAPFEKFRQAIPVGLRQLLRDVPLYRAWYWTRLFWQFGDKVIQALRTDPLWDHPDRSVNAQNDGHRRFFVDYIEKKLRDKPELMSKVVPNYPPFGKRILLDNGWYDTLLRDNVELVTDPLVAMGSDYLADLGGNVHEVDVCIWATGFDAARFVSSVQVVGIDGRTLRDVWNDDDPWGYRGVSVPGFPNFFMLGGPNSFPGSGSFMFVIEMQMRYIARLIAAMEEEGLRAVDAKLSAAKLFTDQVDDGHRDTVWSHPGVQSYYRNRHGRVVFLMPFLNLDFWSMTREADLWNYTVRS